MALDLEVTADSEADKHSFLESAYGLTSGAIISAANDISNSVGIIGETIGVNSYEETSTRDAISSYAGESAAQFYARNPNLVEGAGLFVGTVVPGAVGTKLLRVAQAAKGSTLGRLLALPHSTLGTAREASKAAMIASDSLYGGLSSNTLKALTAGAGANILDAAAFEVAAMTVTFASPVYSDFTAGDYAKSMGFNIAFGGAIGSLFSAAKTSYVVTTAKRAAEKVEAPLRNITVGAAEQTPWVNLTKLAEQLDPTERLIAFKNLGGTDERAAQLLPITEAAIKSEMHIEIGRIAADTDTAQAFSNLLFNPSKGGAAPDITSITALATEVRRGVLPDAATVGRTFDTVTGEAFAAGVTPTKHIGDGLASGHKVFADGDRLVITSATGKPTSIDLSRGFTKLDEVEAQAAWLHASPNQMKHVEWEVAAGDLPRMERLLELSDEVLAKRPVTIGGKAFRTHESIKTALLNEKYLQAEALSGKLLPEQIMTRLNVTKGFLETEARASNMIARSGDELENFLRAPRHVSVIYDIPKLSSATAKFISPRAVTDGAEAEISAAAFIRMRGNEEVRPLVLGAIQKKLADGHKITAPTITVKADGSLVLDGNKRVTALSKMLNDIGAETDHVPVNIKVETGAIIPKFLPDGSPFPVTRNAAGEVIPNPAAVELPARLTRAFQEETLRVDNLNRLHSQERELLAASLLPDTGAMPPESLGLELKKQITSTDKGQGFITNTEAVTGGLGGFTQHVGQLTNKAMRATREITDTAINAPIVKLSAAENADDAAQLIMVANNLKGNPANYVLDRATGSLVREDVAINLKKAAQAADVQARWDAASQAGAISPAQLKQFRTELKAANSKAYPPEGAGVETIKLSANAFDYVAASTTRNTERMAIHTKVTASVQHPSLTTAQQYDLERVYFAPVNTKKYPHFVYVRQAEGINSTSHSAVVTAATAEALETKVKLLRREFPGMDFVGDPKSNYQFLYKKDIEAFHKAKGDYEYARGMNDNAIDSALRSKKLMYEPEGAPINDKFIKEFFDDQVDWHRRMDDKSVRDVVELKYGQLFRELQVLGGAHTKIGTSFFGGSTASSASFAAQSVKNPYADMIKQALDIGKQLEYPMFLKANEFLNTGWSKASLAVNKMGTAMMDAANPHDFAKEAANLNRISNDLGFGNPYQAVMLEKYKDMLPLNPSLTGHIAKSNAVLNFLVLGSDVLQAMNTLIGTTVHATEFTALSGAIKKQGAAAGKLAGLSPEDAPNGIEMLVRSAKEYWTGGEVWNAALGKYEMQTGKQIMEGFVKNGLRVGDAKALADAIDHFAYNPKLTADAFGKTAEAGMEAVRKLTGNTLADAVSRFMAARSMQILTDKALSKGLLSSVAEANIYITQHVTRVHGATLASQRPVMFSGPIGQSIGVFMTFYTNFLQRMFQHAGAGDVAALGTMAGMQVGLYGMQGLPAFNFVNTHLIGNASGNRNHMDVYQAAGGSEEAKWIMYGAGSSLLGLIHPDLRVNLYSRGDLNPRQASIIPITPQDTALYSAVSKTVSNLGQLAQHISGGAGIANSLSFALEHNGVNRPLSGIGALLSGGQTTAKGTLLASYGDSDLSAFAILARVAGGKPLDDATAADALYRNNAYKAATASRINKVGENLRIAMQNGESPDMIGFMQEYTKAGGDIKNFNRYVKRQFLTATNSQISTAAADMGSPQAESLSRLMGGSFVGTEEAD